MIPKIIHVFWISDNGDTTKLNDAIDQWKSILPDYEIMVWNETNFDFTVCRYANEAYACKQYAYLSDYVRFSVLYYYGGIWMDIDVDVVKPFDDLLDARYFIGSAVDFDDNKPTPRAMSFGIFGSERFNPFCAAMLKAYENASFIDRSNMRLKNHFFREYQGIQYLDLIEIFVADACEDKDIDMVYVHCSKKAYIELTKANDSSKVILILLNNYFDTRFMLDNTENTEQYTLHKHWGTWIANQPQSLYDVDKETYKARIKDEYDLLS